MTDTLHKLYTYQWEKKHHAFRKTDLPDSSAYRNKALSDCMRTSLRLKTALENETPVLLPGELIAFTRTLRNLPLIFDDAEWEKIKSEHHIHENGNVCNLSPGYEEVINEGLLSIKARLGNCEEHKAMAVSIDAILELTERYRIAALEAGDNEIAETLARVPAYSPRSFREALQSLRILHYCMWCEGDYHNTLGRFDQYMIPYLRKDLKNGTLTKETAFELLEAFFLSCNRDSDLYPGVQQGDNGQSLVLGGKTKDGGDGFNELSAMCLEASADLMLIDPKINLRVSKDTPFEAYRLGTKLTKLGLGFPQYENDDVVIPGMERLGYSKEDAENYALAACWEIIIPRKGMDIPNIGVLPFANVTDAVIRETLKEAGSMDVLKSEIEKRIYASVRETLKSFKNLYVIPSPYMSLFFEGCVENGRDIADGCVYNNFGLHGTGLATAADMLAAVEKEVFQGTITAETLLSAMEADFKGYEELREELWHNCPKMGNNDDAADKFGVWLLDCFARSLEGLTNERGGLVRAGTGSAMYYIWNARELGSTADGRLKGTPLPANYAPSLNIKLNGPLSLIQSFAKPELSKVINGGPLTIEFAQSAFNNDEAIDKVASLVKLFVSLGGHQLQLNTLNRTTLLEAQAHPEEHRNLIVRVWGWSGYFVELDKCYQDHIIARAELSV